MKQDRIEGGKRREAHNQAVHDALHRLLAAMPPPGTPYLAVPALSARHRAMMLIGLGGSLRPTEVAGLNIGDVALRAGTGLAVRLRPPDGPRTVLIWDNPRDLEVCPVAAFERWMRFRHAAEDWRELAAEDTNMAYVDARRAGLRLFCGIGSNGALMRSGLSDRLVRRLMKEACALAGLGETRLSKSSLRIHLRAAVSEDELTVRAGVPWVWGQDVTRKEVAWG